MNKVIGIRLDSRDAWAWRRLGNQAIRQLIAPEGVCVQCGIRPCQSHSRNQWFCYPCQDELDQASLLPEIETEALQRLNRSLSNQIQKLESQIRDQAPQVESLDPQLDLFPP